MISHIETVTSLGQLTDLYADELKAYSMEQLTRKPSEDEWSLGQMYVHLINTALNMQLRNVEICRDRSGESVTETKGATEAGQAIFAAGGFPPVRIQVPPSPQYTPGQPESKEQLAEGLQTVLRRMKEISSELESIDPRQTVDHPRLGAFNANQWFALVEMHFRHHLLQKKRLQDWLSSSNG
ncbi:DinB family protein [Cohnella faecalis]|nr:DinB family protein [Cohnella faecalis]